MKKKKINKNLIFAKFNYLLNNEFKKCGYSTYAMKKAKISTMIEEVLQDRNIPEIDELKAEIERLDNENRRLRGELEFYKITENHAKFTELKNEVKKMYLRIAMKGI